MTEPSPVRGFIKQSRRNLPVTSSPSTAKDKDQDKDQDKEPKAREVVTAFKDLAITPDEAPFSGLVRILVGPEKTEFKFSQAQLQEYIPFFAACFKKGFAEAKAHTVHLPEENPATVAALLHWTLTFVLFRPSLGLTTPYEIVGYPNKSRLFTGDGAKTLLYLAKLWVLADKFCCIDLQDQIVKFIGHNFLGEKYGSKAHGIEELPCRINQEVVEYVYRNTIPSSRLRRMLLQCWAYCFKRFDVQVHHLQSSFSEEERGEWLNRLWRLVIQYVRTPGGKALTITEYDAMPEASLDDVLFEWLGELGDVIRLRDQKLRVLSFPGDFPDFVDSYELALKPASLDLIACRSYLRQMKPRFAGSWMEEHVVAAMFRIGHFIENDIWSITDFCKEELWNYVSYQFRGDESYRMYPAKECFERYISRFRWYEPEWVSSRRIGPRSNNARWKDLMDCTDTIMYRVPRSRREAKNRELDEDFVPHDPLLPTAETAARRWMRVTNGRKS
ncbi:hypothetical protein K490DRAFT_69910 [Saccharata proteae CBS 121410]|uniref:BTB domain-containing protein n=1 Tax=Saccharata proteae CBS 121410 TaxID=1314787 RepID=A0A9P4HN57_9PEZI|nr:hypothetical protein K490DRAFT_69910 [Saccharata proteae CBS 121410]